MLAFSKGLSEVDGPEMNLWPFQVSCWNWVSVHTSANLLMNLQRNLLRSVSH